MDVKQRIGELLDARGEIGVEWKIPNFFSYQLHDSIYHSRTFWIGESEFYLKIKPNGHSRKDCVGYVSYSLGKWSPNETKAYFEFGIKNANGSVRNRRHISYLFPKGSPRECDWPRFIKRFDLQKYKSDLLPSDTLTLTCKLKLMNVSSMFAMELDVLSSDLLDMFTSGRNADVSVQVRNTNFFAHKFILAARSPVFDFMFQHEISENNITIIDIVDCEPKDFNQFLQYLYSGKLQEIDEGSILRLYEIADKYDVKHLKSICVDGMIQNLRVSNVCRTFALAYKFNEMELLRTTRYFFKDYSPEIFKTEQWVSFMKYNCQLANELLKGLS